MYDALLLLSFGGPEGPDDVMPFLENVTRGRGVPPERLAAVAEHYQHFGGVSPINGQNRALVDGGPRRVRRRTTSSCRSTGATATGIPYVEDTVRAMADGRHRAARWCS